MDPRYEPENIKPHFHRESQSRISNDAETNQKKKPRLTPPTEPRLNQVFRDASVVLGRRNSNGFV